jgi:signal peptidase II
MMSDHVYRRTPTGLPAPDLPMRLKAAPFVLSAVLTVADQLIKQWITETIPVNTIGFRLFEGDFIRIIHVKNNAVAFSLGTNLPDTFRIVLFIAVPLVLIAAIIVYVLRSEEFTLFQRWCIAVLVGGGIGNLIDRIFRSGLVIDYIDVKFYGLFGLERFPTFNLADSSIVVGGILLMGSFLFTLRNYHE